MVKTNKITISVWIVIFLIVSLGVSVGSGIVYNRQLGVCYGLCERDREKEFKREFSSWITEKASCIKNEQTLPFLAEISPNLAQGILSRNKKFSLLSQKEHQGTLTVGEREDYERDGWRVPKPSERRIFSYVAPVEHTETSIVNRCSRDGFTSNAPSSLSVCYGFVNISFTESNLYTGNYVPMALLQRDFYNTLKKEQNLEDFISQMEEDRWHWYDLRMEAKAEVDAMAENLVSRDAIERRTDEAYQRKKCLGM